ncbi:MAG: hypothetical protein HN368_20775 [Spirochaetales bacterium]|nr:hypothetical protein [Spirochaetales bacterium]
MDIQLASRAADLRISDLLDDFDPMPAKVESGRKLVEGILTLANGSEVTSQTSSEEADTAILKKYPGLARIELLNAVNDINLAQRNTNTVIAGLNNDKNYILADNRMTSSLAVGTSLQRDISDLLIEANGYITLAENEIRLAKDFRDKAFEFIADAEELITAEEFDAATTVLNASSSAMIESISHQVDDSFAAEITFRVGELGDEIVRLIEAAVIRDVSSLTTSAISSHQRQEYESAEADLLQAQAKWGTIRSEPDEVIEYWLGLVQTALSVTTGKFIPETDSTYQEMRQTLNYALANFQEAETALDAGNEIDALKLLDDVEKKLSLVLQQYPFNEEAKILNLKISKVEDPERYNEELRNLITGAQAAITDSATAADGYKDLQIVKELDPNYPGLEQLIYTAEVKLGMIQPPKTVQTENRSIALYNDALQIYESGDKKRFKEAIAIIDEALAIDTLNASYRELRTSLLIEVTAVISLNLSSAQDTQSFLKAVDLFSGGKFTSAFRIITTLWRNEENRNYKPLVDLRADVSRAVGA